MAKAVHIWEDPGGWSSTILTYDTGDIPKYTANELSLDLSGSYFAGERHLSKLFDTSIRHNRGAWGGDAGLNYFITRYLGIGGDVEMSDNGGNLVDQVLGNVTLRLPLDPTGLAPYVFGGGGRSTDRTWAWLGDLGVGLEFRFNPVVGIFADGRYILADKGGDRLLLRAGLRLAF
jgi:hypothetical protein